MAYQKLQTERAAIIHSGDNFSLLKDNPIIGIRQKYYSSDGDFKFTVSGGQLTSITMTKLIYKNQFLILPTSCSVSTVSGAGSSATVSLDLSGDEVRVTVSGGGSSYAEDDSLCLSFVGHQILPSLMAQPFVVYTNDASSIDNVVSSGGDSIGTINCSQGTVLPFNFYSLKAAPIGNLVALW